MILQENIDWTNLNKTPRSQWKPVGAGDPKGCIPRTTRERVYPGGHFYTNNIDQIDLIRVSLNNLD